MVKERSQKGFVAWRKSKTQGKYYNVFYYYFKNMNVLNTNVLCFEHAKNCKVYL